MQGCQLQWHSVVLLSVARIAGYPSGLGIAMQVRKNAPTANIRAYMRGNLIYADVRIAVRQEVAHGHP